MGVPDSCSARFEDAAAEITRLEALAPQRSEDACLASFCNEKLFNPAEQAREAIPAWDDAVNDALRIERVYESFRLRMPSRHQPQKPGPKSTEAQADRERAEIARMKAKFAAVSDEDTGDSGDDAKEGPPAPPRRVPPPVDDGPEGEELALMRERLARVLNEAPSEPKPPAPPAEAPAAEEPALPSVEANRARLDALKREIEDRARRRRDELARAEAAKAQIARKAVEASLGPVQKKAEKPAAQPPQNLDALIDSRRKKLDSLKSEMEGIEKKLEGVKGKKEASKIVKQLIASTHPGTGKPDDKERRLAELVRRLKQLEDD